MEPQQEQLQQYEAIIRNLLAVFRDVPFGIVVQSLLGHQVEPIDETNPSDVSLLNDIAALADGVAERFRTTAIDRQVYRDLTGNQPRSFRNNEVGILAELALVQAYQQMQSSLASLHNLSRLPAVGYPDFGISDSVGRTTYIDIKATSRPDQGSPRDFFLTTGQNTRKKVSSSARHLVLGFVTREVGPGRFMIRGWKLVDLSRVNVSLKAEFNADNREIYKPSAIVRQRLLE